MKKYLVTYESYLNGWHGREVLVDADEQLEAIFVAGAQESLSRPEWVEEIRNPQAQIVDL